MIKLKEMITDKELTFVRYGGLSPVKQKGYTASGDTTFHSPPARKGIYAFVQGTYEPFLLSAGEYSGINAKHSKYQFKKDKQGNRIEYNPDDPAHEEYGTTTIGDKEYIIQLKKPKKFRYHGEIWHHLKEFVDRKDILDEKGSWIKTTTDVHKKAYYKTIHSEKNHAVKATKKYFPNFDPNNVAIDKDIFEVFIERVP